MKADFKVQAASSLVIWRLATFTAVRKKLVRMGAFEKVCLTTQP